VNVVPLNPGFTNAAIIITASVSVGLRPGINKLSPLFCIHQYVVNLEALFAVALPYVRVSHLREAGYLQSRFEYDKEIEQNEAFCQGLT